MNFAIPPIFSMIERYVHPVFVCSSQVGYYVKMSKLNIIHTAHNYPGTQVF